MSQFLKVSGLFSAAALAATFFSLPAAAATSCEDLAKISLPNTTITLAQTVGAGAFTPPANAARGGAAPAPAAAAGRGQFADLTAFCRVQASLRPSSDSDIKMEIWMPAAASWNGKFKGTGNGGL